MEKNKDKYEYEVVKGDNFVTNDFMIEVQLASNCSSVNSVNSLDI